MDKSSIDAILLASGFSKRFGEENKLTKIFCGMPLAEHTLRLVCTSNLYRNIYFVCATPAVVSLAQKYPITILHNSHPENGQQESIRLGTSASTSSYYHFFTCDQPLLTLKDIQIITAKRKQNFIVQPWQNQNPASPTLFSNIYKKELMSLKKGETGKTILKKYPNKVIAVEIFTSYALHDIDTPEEFKELECIALHKRNTI